MNYDTQQKNEEDDGGVFRCTIHMDYKYTEHDTINIERAAPNLLEAKKALQNRLNPSGDTIVSLVDRHGVVRMVHTMKVGDVKVEEVNQ